MTNEEKKLSESLEQLKIIIAQQNLQIQEYKRKQTESALHKERAALLDKIQKRDDKIEKFKEQLKARDLVINILHEALRLARMIRFAAHSEKLPSTQSELFDEAEVLSASYVEDIFKNCIGGHYEKASSTETSLSFLCSLI